MSVAAAISAGGPPQLPRLRRDIRIEDGGLDSNGRPVMLVIDPVRNAYFRLSWPTCGILACWQNGDTAQQLSTRVKTNIGHVMTDADFDALLKFLFSSQLTLSDEQGSWQRYQDMSNAGRHGWLMTLVHNYLFFRVPLFHPDNFLRRMLPYVSFIYSRVFLIGFLSLVAFGLYLTSREWDSFEAMFWRMAKLQSITLYAAVLLVLKAIHELGHAFTTVRYGCRVPSMGLAFMLGAPVFYTDTTDSWRLTQRTQRLAIVVAGVGAEFLVAGCAIILWPFLPDGLAREVCFAITTTSLVTTLLVNLNPCMRFDGYFGLSDILDVPNLQPRAFALARWKMRELLFDLGEDKPEHLPAKLQSTLIIYAWATWIYRLFLFCGIAAVVYAMTIKLIGILLGIFEIVMFVLRPIVKEIMEWWPMRAKILNSRRSALSAGVAFSVLAVLFVPWMRIVEAPVVLTAMNEEALHPRMPARIEKVNVTDGQAVNKGDILFVTDSPDLRMRIAKAKAELQAAEAQMSRLVGSDKERASRIVIENQVNRGRERLASLKRLEQDLLIRAPFGGTLVDLDNDASKGVWQGVGRELARVVSYDGVRARGLVTESEVSRLTEGTDAVFIPDDAKGASVRMKLTSIAQVNEKRMVEPSLADVYGGPIPVVDDKKEIAPRSAMFAITLEGDGDRPAMITRGIVRLSASAESPASRVWRQVARVIVREQGF